MIENIIILLVANTLMPYIPIQPTLLLPAPLALLSFNTPSAFQNMNLTRLYKPQDFKKTFKQSVRIHHPDHGGDQYVFQQIQGLKKIMQQPINYYDLYNVTEIDLSSNSHLKIKDVVQIKSITFYVELGMFYFIALLYILAFTLEEQARNARRILLVLAIAFLGYQYYIHEHPTTMTIIDLINDKIPLFQQRNILKRTFIILMAIIRTHFLRKKSDEKLLTESLTKQHSLSEYKDILQKLTQIYNQKAIQKQNYEKSIWAKLRNFISKGVSLIFLLLIIKSAINL